MPERRSADVVIVGGGIAGPALACALAASQRRVVLIERSAEPPDTARGDHLQPVTCEWLAHWGVLDDMWAAGAERRLGSRYLTPQGDTVLDASIDQLDIPYPHYLYLNHEQISACLLAAAARNPNFELLRPATARLVDTGHHFEVAVDSRYRLQASLVVAADGRHSRLRKAAGIDAETVAYRNPMLTFFAPRTLSDPRNEVRAYLAPQGVISVVPRTGGEWKIGWPVPLDELGFWRNADTRAQGERLAEMVPDLEGIEPRVCGVYPVAMINAAHWYTRNLVLIGDACHAMHPGLSQGMNIALRAVYQLAGLMADNAVWDGPDRLAGMLQKFESELRPQVDQRLAANHARGQEMDQLDPATIAGLQAGLAAVAADPALLESYRRRAAGY